MKIFGYTVPQSLKAVVGFFTPGVVALGVALAPTSPGGASVTPIEWCGITLAMFATGGLVFRVGNAPSIPPK